MLSKPLLSKARFAASGLLLLTVCACTDDPPADGGGEACNTNYAAIAAGAPQISFRNDILPIFSLACTASECHNVYDPKPKANLVLGVKGIFQAGANKWNYTFPPESNFTNDGGDLADGGLLDPIKDPHPLTDAVVNLVHADLMLASKTVPTVNRVTPLKPEQSFIVDKLAGVQNSQPYSSTCDNQDPVKSKEGPCGDHMPAVGSALCGSPDRFNAVVQWIAQGAQKN